MQRISILGCSGAGKSTFAQALGVVLGRKVDHLDLMFWSPEMQERSRAERELALSEVLNRPDYILEGGYPWTYDRRIADCDTLIWMETPAHQQFFNLLRRAWSRNERVGMHKMDAVSRKRLHKRPSVVSIAVQQHLDVLRMEPVFAAPPPGKRLIRLKGMKAGEIFLDRLRQQRDAASGGAASGAK